MSFHRGMLGALLCVSLLPTVTYGQEGPTGIDDEALPGLHRVRVAEDFRVGLSASAALGYGFTESVLGDRDQHHSALNTLAASYALRPWLTASAGLSNRFDIHRRRFDTTFVGTPVLSLRGAFVLDSEWHGGLQLNAWFPTLSTVSVDALFLASKSPGPRWRYHLNGGIRIDRTAEALEEDRLMVMTSDLLTLGTSDSNALLLAAGLDYRVWKSVDVFGEWSYDLLIGEKAPEIKESPMRFALGARFPVMDYQMSVSVETNISRVVPIDPRLSLSPVEPIVALRVGLSLRPPPPPIAPLVATIGRIDGVVLSPGDAPIAGATVTVGDVNVQTQEDGVFQFAELPVGLVDVKITAPGHIDSSYRAEVMPGRVVHLPIVAVPKDTPGQIRFFVRGLEGEGVLASLLVRSSAEGAEETQMASGEDGSAELDLPPGEYTVTASAKGYASQERKVQVDAYGVTILNLELMTKRIQK